MFSWEYFCINSFIPSSIRRHQQSERTPGVGNLRADLGGWVWQTQLGRGRDTTVESGGNSKPKAQAGRGAGAMQDVVFRSGTCGISLRGAGHWPGDDREPGASPAPGAAPSRERWSIVIVK